MRPWQHARSSAGKLRSWTDDLDVHEFVDASKFACADRRHRVVLHHVDLGAAVTSRVFNKRSDILEVVTSHVVEDLGRTATVEDWFEHCDTNQLPRPVTRRLANGHRGIAEMISGRQPSLPFNAVAIVSEFLFSPMRFLPRDEVRALPLFMNAFGPLIVRRVFGPPSSTDEGSIVDHGWIAEAVIYAVFGRIPDLGEVVRCWTSEPVRAAGENY